MQALPTAPRVLSIDEARKRLAEVPATVHVDAYPGQMREYYFIQHPALDARNAAHVKLAEEFASTATVQPIWLHYLDTGTLVRTVPEDVYFTLRTARNRDLITPDEQKAYRESVVGIAGLSVGSAAVAALVATGGPRYLKLADPDTIETTNLNRIKASLLDVGSRKTDVAARSVWMLDPFAEVELWPEGVSKDSLERFVSEPKLSVFVDEMDDIALKFACRARCKAAGIPVVMATDNGDGALVDVERFDTEPGRPIFHGRVGPMDVANGTMDRAAFVRMANEIIDPRFFSERQLSSVKAVGTTLSGIPQLGTAAMIAGAAVAYAVRTIVTGQPLPSGRYLIGCEKAFSDPMTA